MADISIVVASDDREVVSTIKSVEKLQGSTRKLSDAFERGSIDEAKYNRGLKEIQRELQKVGVSHQKATALVRKYAAEYADTTAYQKRMQAELQMSRVMDQAHAENVKRIRLEEQATKQKVLAQQKEAQELDRLRSKYSPLYAASKQYERSLIEIDRALDVGAISLAQHGNAVEELQKDYSSFAQGTAGWENQFVQGMNRGGKSLNRFGMYAQQVGYQVGDFFVQVQSGQSAMVAFVQQGTQLAGLLPGMRGAVVGIGLSVAGALYMAFRDVNEEADEFTERLKEAREYSQGIADDLALAASGLGSQEELTLVTQIERAEENLQELLATYERLSANQFNPFDGSSGNEQEIAYGNVLLAQQELDLLRERQELLAQMEYDKEQAVETGERLLQIRADELERQREANLLYEAETSNLANQRYLASESLRLRGDELGLSREVFEVNLDTYIQELRLQGVRESQLAILAQQKRDIFELGLQLDAVTAEAERLSREYGISLELATQLAGIILYPAIDAAANAAATLASNLASALNFASQIPGAIGAGFSALNEARSRVGTVLDRVSNAVPGALRNGFDGAIDNLAGLWGEAQNPLNTQTELEDWLSNTVNPVDTGGGSGSDGSGGSGGTPEKTLAQIEAEIQLRQELANAVGEEGEILRQIEDLKKQLGDTAENYTAEEIRASAERLVAYQREQEAIQEIQKRQEELANNIASQFGSAVNSIVDGTKTVEEAFKEMASSIIKQLYDVLVVQQLVGSFDGATGTGTGLAGFIGKAISGGFADGGAFNRGSVVPFAVGGVVNGPTTFPMSGNRTGLMGEAGPEAIMPLARGSDGKLGVSVSGKSGDVYVQQYFQISANGDESVKKIIQNEMPRIADAAKTAVVNAKQRGGSFSRRLS